MNAKKVHMIGVGGIGMSAIAQILIQMGYTLTGSDQNANEQTEKLKAMGAKIYKGHDENHLTQADVVVVSSAISPNNPELLKAHRLGITMLTRGQMLAELMRKKKSIVVAGSHGKTTTSAMITNMLLESGQEATAVIGGILKRISGNAMLGKNDWFVAESDESDGSFLNLLPLVGVITNIDQEHLNHYGTFEKLQEAFVHFSNSIPFDGLMIICKENAHAMEVFHKTHRPKMSYGLTEADVMACDVVIKRHLTQYNLMVKGQKLGNIELKMLGMHNVLNSLAVCAVGLYLGLTFEQIQKGLITFHGLGRRLEHKGQGMGVRVIDDYAHHPSEIEASLNGVCQSMSKDERVRVLFQPHRFSRLGALWEEFASSFQKANEVVLLPVYAASEKPIEGVDSRSLAKAIEQSSKVKAHVVDDLEQACEYFFKTKSKGDVVVTMGAGNVTLVSDRLVEKLKGDNE